MTPLRTLVLALAAAAARAGWHDGSGILLQVPPLGVAGDAASMDAAMEPISGKVFGLPMPFTQHPGGGLVVLLLNNAVCNIWWDKGHNVPAFKAAFTAAAPVLADGSFEFPRGWDSGCARASQRRAIACRQSGRSPALARLSRAQVALHRRDDAALCRLRRQRGLPNVADRPDRRRQL